MNTFDHPSIRTLRAEIQAALNTVAVRHQLSLKVGSCRFSHTAATLKLEAAVINAKTGVVESREREDFKLHASRFGLTAADLDKVFDYAGRTFTISGLRPRAYSKPILATSQGLTYKFSAVTVQNATSYAKSKIQIRRAKAVVGK